MTYQEAIDYLYSFIDYGRQRQARYAPDAISLARPRQMLAALGDPHKTYPIIHLTGTKGKGSVGAMTAAMLQAAGYRVGLFSSPHLQDFRERIKVNQDWVAAEDLIALVEQIQPIVAEVAKPTWFEVVAVLALEYFRRAKVDIAVIEVGLGGRLDSTNVVEPLLSIITSISHDHTQLLGDTLGQIAREKAGIIKPHTPVISAPQNLEALTIIEAVAQSQQAPLTLIGRDWLMERETPQTDDPLTERWLAGRADAPMQPYQTLLLGGHQAINGTVALAAMDILSSLGWDIPETSIQQGLMSVNWPGRLEIIRQQPPIILDAAHNGASARWLAQTLRERFPLKPLTLVFAAKSDKDIEGMLRALLPLTDHLIVTQAIDSRAEAPEEIAALAQQLAYTGALEVVGDVPQAMQKAEHIAGVDGLVCVTGSLYLVGEVRSLYGLQAGQAAYLSSQA